MMGGGLGKMMGGAGGGMPPGLPGGMGGMPGSGAMPDLSKMSPQEMQKMAQDMGIKMPGGKGPFGGKK